MISKLPWRLGRFKWGGLGNYKWLWVLLSLIKFGRKSFFFFLFSPIYSIPPQHADNREEKIGDFSGVWSSSSLNAKGFPVSWRLDSLWSGFLWNISQTPDLKQDFLGLFSYKFSGGFFLSFLWGLWSGSLIAASLMPQQSHDWDITGFLPVRRTTDMKLWTELIFGGRETIKYMYYFNFLRTQFKKKSGTFHFQPNLGLAPMYFVLRFYFAHKERIGK